MVHCVQTGYYKKGILSVIWLQIFSAAILPNIIKINQCPT